MPTSTELLDRIRAALADLGATYVQPAARDVRYGIWLFALILDEARLAGYEVELHGLDANGNAVFRRNPSTLGGSYTHAYVKGGRRWWQVHVDVYALGISGARHGVDVSIVHDARVGDDDIRLDKIGMGLEAKCFGSTGLDPADGRATLGFAVDTGAREFLLVANRDNETVATMLGSRAHATGFVGDAAPGRSAEAAIRRAVRSQLAV